MKKYYDDFTKLGLKDMSKAMSDMVFEYIDPTTGNPTKVPPIHFEKTLNQVQEQFLSEIANNQFLGIIYNQLTSLLKDNEKFFYQALMCIEMDINPSKLRLNEQVALKETYNYFIEKMSEEGKNFHLLRDDIKDHFNQVLEDPSLQGDAMKINNALKDMNIINNQPQRQRSYDER